MGGFIDLRVALVKGGMETSLVSENAISCPATWNLYTASGLRSPSRLSGVVDIPNSCSTVYLPTAIFDIDVRPPDCQAVVRHRELAGS